MIMIGRFGVSRDGIHSGFIPAGIARTIRRDHSPTDTGPSLAGSGYFLAVRIWYCRGVSSGSRRRNATIAQMR